MGRGSPGMALYDRGKPSSPVSWTMRLMVEKARNLTSALGTGVSNGESFNIAWVVACGKSIAAAGVEVACMVDAGF